MNIEPGRPVCVEAETFDVRKWCAVWHGRAEKAAEEGHVLVTRRSGGTERLNKHREREAMKGVP